MVATTKAGIYYEGAGTPGLIGAAVLSQAQTQACANIYRGTYDGPGTDKTVRTPRFRAYVLTFVSLYAGVLIAVFVGLWAWRAFL